MCFPGTLAGDSFLPVLTLPCPVTGSAPHGPPPAFRQLGSPGAPRASGSAAFLPISGHSLVECSVHGLLAKGQSKIVLGILQGSSKHALLAPVIFATTTRGRRGAGGLCRTGNGRWTSETHSTSYDPST